MGYRYGRKSSALLAKACPTIQKVFSVLIERTAIDISITSTLRTDNEQNALFQQGRTRSGRIVTNCDGYQKKSMHQELKPGAGSSAIDIQIYHKDSSYSTRLKYDAMHLTYIAGEINAIVEELYNKGEIDNKLRWGGNWDGDGIIKYDQDLQDLCHWEIIE